MAKSGEIGYLESLRKEFGEHAVRHAVNKPFSDPNCPGYLAEMGALLALLPPPPARLLDLGCGTGWTSLLFAKCGYDVTAVDIAGDMIHYAEETCRRESVKHVRFVVADYEGLVFDQPFDAVVFYDSLHHAMDETAALRCAYTALKAGGVCVTSEPGRGHDKANMSQEAMRKYNVTEKPMPPGAVWSVGRRVGFREFRVFPHAFTLQREVFRRPHANVAPMPGPTVLRALRRGGAWACAPFTLLYRAARLAVRSEAQRWWSGIPCLVK